MSQLRGGVQAPQTPFPLLPLRTGALFPGTIITLPVGRARSIALLRALEPGAVVGVVAQKDANVVDPGEGDLHPVGTYARVRRAERVGDAEYRVVLEGIGRFELTRFVGKEPFWRIEARPLTETRTDTPAARALAESLLEQVRELAQGEGQQPDVRAVD